MFGHWKAEHMAARVAAYEGCCCCLDWVTPSRFRRLAHQAHLLCLLAVARVLTAVEKKHPAWLLGTYLSTCQNMVLAELCDDGECQRPNDNCLSTNVTEVWTTRIASRNTLPPVYCCSTSHLNNHRNNQSQTTPLFVPTPVCHNELEVMCMTLVVRLQLA